MEDKRADPSEMKEHEDEVVTESDKMECEEVLSGSESVEMTEERTESSDKMLGTDDKTSEPSPMASDSTSGIEVKSGSSSSQESTPVEAAASEESTAAVVSVASEESAGAVAAVSVPKSTVVPQCSPPAKQSLMGTIIKYLSPTKKDHDKSPKEKSGSKSKIRRSKSMSPPEKSVEASPRKEQKELVAECTGEASDKREDTFKKGTEKKGVMKTVKAAFAKIIPKSKSVNIESETLVTNEGDEKEVSAPKPKEKEPSADDTEDVPGKLYWSAGRNSLTQRPSISGTLMTDITSSGSDVSGVDSIRRPSEPENISVEAVAGSHPSSPDQMSDIQSDKEAPVEENAQKEPIDVKDEEASEEKEDKTQVNESKSEDSEMKDEEPQKDQEPQAEK